MARNLARASSDDAATKGNGGDLGFRSQDEYAKQFGEPFAAAAFGSKDGEEVLVEICDPESGRRLPAGQLGQVVVTRFNGIFFLMRFGTGDLSRLIEAPCACGRTAYRLDGIAGRVGEAVKVRGMFVAPSQIQRLAQRFSGKPFRVHVRREGDRDLLVVRVEGAPDTPGEGWSCDEEFKRVFREICTVGVDRLEWVPRGTLAATDRPLVDERDWR